MRRNFELGLAAGIALVLAAASGCQSPPSAPAATPTVPPDAGTEAPALPVAEEDTCGAAGHASLIGQDYKQVPPAPEGKVIRVLCSTCAMTMDFNPQRLNVVYDDGSGLIRRLSCG